MRILNVIYLLGLMFLALPSISSAERVKDLASIAGVRSNPLIGYGIVVGLDGSGDQSSQAPFALQSLKSMLSQYGVTLPANIKAQVKNIAAVIVHAELPAFTKVGQSIDITVSSLGNAKSLRGGSLLMTALKGVDGNIYAIAQGSLVVGGFGVEGKDGSSVTLNIPSVGRIPNGAMVEREVLTALNKGDSIQFNLHSPDFTTAKHLVDTLNTTLGSKAAVALDASSIKVSAPKESGQRVGFIAFLENLEVAPGEAAAKVIINSRTGTIVIGSHVRVSPAAVTHGGMTVSITSNPIVSQPGALSQGETVVVPKDDIEVSQEKNRMFLFDTGVTLSEIVRAVNQVGAAPGDLVAILEALKQVGALKAQLIVI